MTIWVKLIRKENVLKGAYYQINFFVYIIILFNVSYIILLVI